MEVTVIAGSELKARWLLARAAELNEAAVRQADFLVFEFSEFIVARSSSFSDAFLFHVSRDRQKALLFLRQSTSLCHSNLFVFTRLEVSNSLQEHGNPRSIITQNSRSGSKPLTRVGSLRGDVEGRIRKEIA